jgi:hypothetical protein
LPSASYRFHVADAARLASAAAAHCPGLPCCLMGRQSQDVGRVEDWRGIPKVRPILLAPRFLWECLTNLTVNPFPAPATSHVACGFPALRAPAQFMSRVMRPIDWSDCRDGLSITDSVPRKESKRALQPFPAPPLPAEAPMLARPGQMTPNLLFYPVSDIGETPARMSDGKIFHPTTQDRINLFDHSAHRLRTRGPKNLPERPAMRIR